MDKIVLGRPMFLWRRLGDKALPYFGPPRRRLSPPRRLGGGDSP